MVPYDIPCKTLMKLRTLILLASVSVMPGTPAFAAERALPAGAIPDDARIQPLKDLNGYFPFTPPTSKGVWQERAAQVKKRILVSQGLWPLPTRTPLNPVLHGKVEEKEFTIEKVYFESVPGFYVTGSLYRPKGRSGKVPAVLCPHGHWKDGRYYDHQARVRQDITIGAERFEDGGRNHIQARCVQLARMGCVAFAIDMIGYADSGQLSYELVHRFAKQRPEMNTPADWGFFSPPAESHLQNVMGLQTWNNMRALDFLLSLPEVDSRRIAVTGASGGGTQTMLLAAVDDRVALSMPMVMVSTSMQGGCTCENSSLLRVATGNIEFAALFAPKPQIMNCADDWTRELATKGFPDIQKLYGVMGKKDNVRLIRGEHFKHNYNYVTRAQMYSWINRHFKLGFKDPIVEEDFHFRPKAEMTVWNDEHPQPKGGDEFERKLVASLTRDIAKQLKPAQQSVGKLRDVYGTGWEVALGRTYAETGETEWDLKSKHDCGGYLEMIGLVRNTTQHEELPVTWLYPKNWSGRTVVWLSEQGKDGLFDANGKPQTGVQKLLDENITVVGVDLLDQGEFLKDGKASEKTRKVANPREFAGFTFGYNTTLFARRVHDVMTLVKFITTYPRHQNRQLDLVALDQTGVIAAAARAFCRDEVKHLACNTAGFRFLALKDFHDPFFIPGAAKYGDTPGLLALNAPASTHVFGETASDLALVTKIYKSANAQKSISIEKGGKANPQQAVDWLLKN